MSVYKLGLLVSVLQCEFVIKVSMPTVHCIRITRTCYTIGLIPTCQLLRLQNLLEIE